MNIPPFAFEQALSVRTDLSVYNDNALMLFALQMHLDATDIHAIASEALTDGRDDKKLDLVYVDRAAGKIIIAQGYHSQDRSKESAKGNKAADLNTGLSWLLSRNIDDLPDQIKDAAENVRSALNANEINSFMIWYVHNLPQHENIQNELKTVECTAFDLIKTNFPNAQIDIISAMEVGRDRIEEWYKNQDSAIKISANFTVDAIQGYETKGSDWKAFATTISGAWLKEIYSKHPSDLFSANVRGYMGSRKKDQKINFDIQESASNNPRDFWVFNNGITAIVHDYEAPSDDNPQLIIKGICIANGAQTTGSISTIKDLSDDLRIPIRFIACSNQAKVKNIITYNNRQNQILASDFRSNDAIQTRLRQEFTNDHKDVSYFGGRRDYDFTKSKTPELPTDTCAQALAAVHLKPWLAYHGKSKIWEDNDTYNSLFNEDTTASHILFAMSLLRAVEKYKLDLVEKSKVSDLSEKDSKTLSFMRKRGSIYLLASAISRVLETVSEKKVANRFKLQFAKINDFDSAVNFWTPIIASLAALNSKLDGALRDSLTNTDRVNSCLEDFNAYLSDLMSVGSQSNTTYLPIAQEIKFS